MIKIGDDGVKKLYLGDFEVLKVYKGDILIYQSEEPTPPTPQVPNTEIWVTTTDGTNPLYKPLCDWMRMLDCKRTPNEDGSWAVIRMFFDEFIGYMPDGENGFYNLNGVEKIQFPNSITSFTFATTPRGSNPTLEFNLPNGCLAEDGNCTVDLNSLLEWGTQKIDINIDMTYDEFVNKMMMQGTINIEFDMWRWEAEGMSMDNITFHFKDGDYPIDMLPI